MARADSGAVVYSMDEEQIAREIRTIQTLGSIAIIASPVSLVFGGVLLALAALICAIVARMKLNALMARDVLSQPIATMLKRQSTVGIALSAVALVIDSVAFAMAFGTLMHAMQSGDKSSINQMLGMDANLTDSANTDATNTSIWDS